MRGICVGRKQKYLIVVSEDCSVRLFDNNTLEELVVKQKAHMDHIYSVAIGTPCRP